MSGKRIIDPAERERRRLTLLERDREHTSAGHYRLTPDQQRARTMKLRHLADGRSTGWSQPPTRVLVDWHTDEYGCRARVVGCD